MGTAEITGKTMDSDTNDSRLRLRAVLSAQYTVILVVCLLCVAAGAGVVYSTHVDPGTETQTEVVSTWTIETEHEHSAEVTEPNTVFPVGTQLTDRETYFTRIAPEVDVDVVTSYEAATAEDVTVETESTLVLRNAEDGVVYWEETEPLAAETTTDLGGDDDAVVSFTLNSTAIDEEVGAIDDELGASPGTTETFVVTDLSVEGTLNGEDVVHGTSLEFGIDHGGDTYTVDDPGSSTESAQQTETVEVERTYGPLRTVGSPLLLLVGLAGASGLVYARRRNALEPTDAERAYLEYRDERSEFDEWITRIRLPASVHDRPEATADSLTDLVDFAIDNDVGVINDPETGAYHAVAGEFLYTYRPPHRSSNMGSEVTTDDDGPADGGDPADGGLFAGAQGLWSGEDGSSADERVDDADDGDGRAVGEADGGDVGTDEGSDDGGEADEGSDDGGEADGSGERP